MSQFSCFQANEISASAIYRPITVVPDAQSSGSVDWHCTYCDRQTFNAEGPCTVEDLGRTGRGEDGPDNVFIRRFEYATRIIGYIVILISVLSHAVSCVSPALTGYEPVSVSLLRLRSCPYHLELQSGSYSVLCQHWPCCRHVLESGRELRIMPHGRTICEPSYNHSSNGVW